MRKVTKRYFDCLTDMYTSTRTNGSFSNMREMTNFYGIAPGAGSVLQKMNLVQKHGAGRASSYSWIGGVPDEPLALSVIEEVNKTSPSYKGTRNGIRNQIQLEKTQSEKLLQAANIHSLDETFKKVYEGIALAEKFEIPKEKVEEFVKTIMFNKR